MTSRRGVVLLQQEPGAAGKAYVDAQMRGPLSGFPVEVEHPSGDKYTRALPMSSSAQAGNIKLVRGRWNKDFLDELEQAGPDEKLYDHDDQWDAAASAFNHLAAHRREALSYTPVRWQTSQVEASSNDKDSKFGKPRQLGSLIKSRRWGPGGY